MNMLTILFPFQIKLLISVVSQGDYFSLLKETLTDKIRYIKEGKHASRFNILKFKLIHIL